MQKAFQWKNKFVNAMNSPIYAYEVICRTASIFLSEQNIESKLQQNPYFKLLLSVVQIPFMKTPTKQFTHANNIPLPLCH